MTAHLGRSILRDPAFGRLWFIQASTQVGGNMSLYALTILVFATTRSNAAVSALVLSFLVPTILLSALAGVLVDRLDARWAMIVPNTIRTALTFGLAVAGANVALLLVLNLGISLTSVVLTPAEASMIPRIVPKPQLETAMGIFNLTLQGSFVVGFAFLGPMLVAVAGPSFVLVVVTAFYAAATVTTLFLPPAPPVTRDPAVGRRTFGEPIDQLREGLAAIKGNRELGRPLILLAAATSLVGVIGVLGANLALSIGLDPNNLIVVVLPLGLGVVAGVFGLTRLGDRVPRRRAGEGGLLAFGVLGLAIASVSPIAAATRPAAHPGRHRPGVRRWRGLRDDNRVGPDGHVREHAGRRPRSRVWRARIGRQCGQPRPDPGSGPARRRHLRVSRHRARGDRRTHRRWMVSHAVRATCLVRLNNDPRGSSFKKLASTLAVATRPRSFSCSIPGEVLEQLVPFVVGYVREQRSADRADGCAIRLVRQSIAAQAQEFGIRHGHASLSWWRTCGDGFLTASFSSRLRYADEILAARAASPADS